MLPEPVSTEGGPFKNIHSSWFHDFFDQRWSDDDPAWRTRARCSRDRISGFLRFLAEAGCREGDSDDREKEPGRAIIEAGMESVNHEIQSYL
jgi:hypothetical protein